MICPSAASSAKTEAPRLELMEYVVSGVMEFTRSWKLGEAGDGARLRATPNTVQGSHSDHYKILGITEVQKAWTSAILLLINDFNTCFRQPISRLATILDQRAVCSFSHPGCGMSNTSAPLPQFISW